MWNIIRQTMLLQMKQSFARPMFRFCLFINPIMNTIFLYEEFLNSGQQNFTWFITISAGLMGLWGCICFSSIGDINRERYSGTLPLIYVAPGGFGLIIVGKVLGNTLLSLLSFVITYGMTILLSRGFFFVAQPLYFIGAFFMTILCFLLISVCLAYVLMLSRKTELYMNLLEIPLIFVCGFTFPIENLPYWVQRISHLIPATWAVKMFRMSISFGNAISESQVAEYNKCFYLLVLEMGIMTVLTVFLFRAIDRMVRQKATLEVA